MQKWLTIAFLLLLLGIPKTQQATHIVGGEIFYECLGNNQYRVTLRVYRDCFGGQAPFDNPAYVTAFNANGFFQNFTFFSPQVTNIPVVVDNPCLVVPPNVCVEEGEYTKVITLPPDPNGYTLVYQRCCRNNTVLNLSNSGNQGGTYTVQIPGNATANCNNSAYFKDFPPVAICSNDPLVFDHGAIDPDGDSLVYRLCAPYRGASSNNPAPNIASAPPYGTVNFSFGYSATNPMDGNPGLSIDPQTGVITGTPTLAGQFVVGVCVDEYRNGIVINTLRRDFQFNVANCNKVTQAIIPGASDGFIAVCDSLTFTFGNQSIGATSYFWDFGVPNSQADTSRARTPTFTFPDTGIYQVRLIANPRTPCVDTTDVEVRVFPGIRADFFIEPQCPQEPIVFDNLSNTTYGSIIDQFWSFGDGSSSIDVNPVKTYDRSGLFNVSLTIENDIGCVAIKRDTLRIHPLPVAAFDLEGRCILDTITLTNQSTVSSGQLTQFDWRIVGDSTFSTDSNTTHIFQQAGNYTVQLIITTDQGCRDTTSQNITIRPQPEATALGDTIVCPGEPVRLSATGGDSYNWGPFGVTFDTPTDSNTLAYPLEPTQFVVTVADDCYFDTAHVFVDVFPTPTIQARPDTSIIAGEPVALTATSDAGDDFVWTPTTYLDSAAERFPIARPESNMLYLVSIANSFGCESSDEVQIWVEPICDQLFIPEAFTPNGDGRNDEIAPIDFGQNEMISFQVFNRYGQLVFESSSFGETWDGTLHGEELPMATYAYLLRVLCDEREVLYSGNITLIR